MKHDAIIIGGGLFGQVIAHALRAEGRDVVVYDDRRPEAGSLPAACLMKPSWFSGLGKDVYEPSLKLLDDLFGVKDIKFALRPLKVGGKFGTATVHWCDPSDILGGPTSPGSVERVQVGHVQLKGNVEVEADLIVVAAGVWTSMLLPQFPQVAQKGAAFLLPNERVKEPFIRPWAPYRQLVAFNRGDGLWVGDGTAIKSQNWTPEHYEKNRARCEDAVGMSIGNVEALIGQRPYSKAHKRCLLEEVKPGLWVASGGAKNGTVVAGYCAHIIREATNG